jgi:serine/threonine protein kinase
MTAQVIGKYRVEERLGAGSFATVWLAYDPDLEARVAIKVLAENWADNEAVKQRFLREARILLTLDSAFIVRIFTTGWLDDGRPYFVMEYGDGGSLEARMRERREQSRRFSVEEAVALSQQIAQGLIAAHVENIIHRDLKPSNILFRRGRAASGGSASSGERLMLVDFGIARQLEVASGTTITGGTLGYAAPEQFDPRTANQVDARSDIYAAATILYELLAGQLPFPQGSTGQLVTAKRQQAPPPITTVRPDVPRALAEVIAKGLAVDPNQRYPSAQAWNDALGQVHTEAHPIRLDPAVLSGSVPLGTPLMFTATIPEESGETGATLIGLAFSVTGTNPQTRMVPIGGDGTARFSYAGTQPGVDTVLATMNLEGRTISSNAVSVTWDAPAVGRRRAGLSVLPPGGWLRQRPLLGVVPAGVVALIILAVALVVSRARATPLDPQGLFSALLDTPVKASELPAGFSSAGSPYSNPGGLSDSEKQFHALWEVEMDQKGPSGEGKDAVYYDIFPTEADAHAYFDSPDQKSKGNFTAPGFGKNLATCYDGTATDSTSQRTYGFTACDVLVKNVFIQGSSDIYGDAQQGNHASAIALAHFGAAHLQRFNFRGSASSGQVSPVSSARVPSGASPVPVQTQPVASSADRLLAVLQSAVVDSKEALPADFSSPQQPAKVTLNGDETKFHALGEVDVSFNGPDAEDFLGFVVFPTGADAQGQFQEQQGPGNTVLPGSSYPSTCYSGHVSSENPEYGFTQCEVLIGNTLAFGDSRIHGSAPQQGNRNSTAALTQFAVAHLQYTVLLNSALSPSELPRGFSAAERPAAFAPDSEDSSFHAVIDVSNVVTGPDSEDGLGYVIFPTTADAQAEFKDQQGAGTLTVPGSSYPSACYSGSDSSASPAYGFTECVELVGTMYVYGNSRVYGSRQEGNPTSAAALAQLAAAHLKQALPALPR